MALNTIIHHYPINKYESGRSGSDNVFCVCRGRGKILGMGKHFRIDKKVGEGRGNKENRLGVIKL